MGLASPYLLFAASLSTLLSGGCRTAAPTRTASPTQNIVFVCEHGNVKSLIAASWFNQIAAARALPFRAESRGLNPEASVPGPIVAALQAEGVEVSTFKPRALSHEDTAQASRVVAIGVDLASFAGDARAPIQLWSDVPPASVDYASSRAALLRHIELLLQELRSSQKD